MGLHGCTLKLASVPNFSSPTFLFKTPTLRFQKSPLSRPIRALSSSALVQTSTTKATEDQGHHTLFSFFSFTFVPTSQQPNWFFLKKKIALSGVKPQWKATIDFKWIKDNKEAVAANLKNRNSDADLNLVLHLYDKMFTLQKVMLCYVSLRSFSSFSYNQFWINSNLIFTL